MKHAQDVAAARRRGLKPHYLRSRARPACWLCVWRDVACADWRDVGSLNGVGRGYSREQALESLLYWGPPVAHRDAMVLPEESNV